MAEDHFLVLAPKPLVALLCNVGHSEGHVGSLNNDVSFDVDEGSHVQKTNFSLGRSLFRVVRVD